MAEPVGEHREVPGRRLLILALVGTVIFTVAALAASVWRELRGVATVVSLVLFFVGIVAFLVAYARAIGRSRTELLGVGGVFFLAGSAPRPVRRVLMGLLGVQIAVALVVASLHPFTSLAFAVLVPMFGVGVAGCWGAIHGVYPDRRKASASVTRDE